jgi:(+)-trans-carveol dehydrogenase
MAGRMADQVAVITGAARGQDRSHAVRLAHDRGAVTAETGMPTA